MNERAALTKTPENKGKDSVSAKSKENFYESLDSPVERILHLQRTIGNQAVQRLLKSGSIQAKLKISKPNDKYEKEADRVADKVMSMLEQEGALINGHSSLAQRKSECPEKEGIQTKPLAVQITPLVQRQVGHEEKKEPIQTKLLQQQVNEEEEEEEEEPIQAKQATNQTTRGNSNIESNVNSLKGGGQPLPESTRSFFEPRFGVDFSQVRMHSDSKAAEAAKAINATAFTKGKDIVFGAGHYSPKTTTGKKLLAHELTHVVQQQSRIKLINRQVTDSRTLTGTDDISTVSGDASAEIQCCVEFDIFSFNQDVSSMSENEMRRQYQAVQDFYSLYGVSHPAWSDAVSFESRLLEEANNRLIILEPFGGRYWLQYAACLSEQIASGATNIMINGSPGFAGRIHTLLNRLMTETLSGYLLVLELVRGEMPLYIDEAFSEQSITGAEPLSISGRLKVWPDEEESTADSFEALPVEEQRPRGGSGTQITLDLNVISNTVSVGRDDSGNMIMIEMGPLITLAHELIHALHNQQGVNLATGNTILGYLYPVRNPITGESANPEELFTIRGQRHFEAPQDRNPADIYWPTQFNLPYGLFSISENEIRDQLGLPERVSHRGAVRSQPGTYNAGETIEHLVNRYYRVRGAAVNRRARSIIVRMIRQLNPQIGSVSIFRNNGELSLPTPNYIDLYYRYVLNQPETADYFPNVSNAT
jgi:hypothetical protein